MEKNGKGLLSCLPRVILGDKSSKCQLSDINEKLIIRQGQGGMGQCPPPAFATVHEVRVVIHDDRQGRREAQGWRHWCRDADTKIAKELRRETDQRVLPSDCAINVSIPHEELVI